METNILSRVTPACLNDLDMCVEKISRLQKKTKINASFQSAGHEVCPFTQRILHLLVNLNKFLIMAHSVYNYSLCMKYAHLHSSELLMMQL